MDSDVQQTVADFFADKTIQHQAKGTIITLAGEAPNGITYLTEGVIEQYHITPQGNKVVVNVFKPPAFFPMSWAINGTPNTYFYATLTDITYRQASATDTVMFLKQNPEVTFDLLSRVYRGTDALLKRIVIAASGAATNRLIFELLIEAYRFGKQISDSQWEVAVRQTVLASRSGLARETISRELHELAETGSITFVKQGFVLNIEKLEEQLDSTI